MVVLRPVNGDFLAALPRGARTGRGVVHLGVGENVRTCLCAFAADAVLSFVHAVVRIWAGHEGMRGDMGCGEGE